MEAKLIKRKNERLRLRKRTLFRRGYELAKLCNVDVAVVVFQRGQYHIYKSIERDDWPPSMADIVSQAKLYHYAWLNLSKYSKTPTALIWCHHTTLNSTRQER
jgi:hypothetical protein